MSFRSRQKVSKLDLTGDLDEDQPSTRQTSIKSHIALSNNCLIINIISSGWNYIPLPLFIVEWLIFFDVVLYIFWWFSPVLISADNERKTTAPATIQEPVEAPTTTDEPLDVLKFSFEEEYYDYPFYNDIEYDRQQIAQGR